MHAREICGMWESLNNLEINKIFMTVTTVRPAPLRTIAAVILGTMIGSILFFVVALLIGSVNDLLGMNIPLNLKFAENVWSLIILVIFVVLSIAGIYWAVLTTPPTEPEIGSLDSEIEPDCGIPN